MLASLWLAEGSRIIGGAVSIEAQCLALPCLLSLPAMEELSSFGNCPEPWMINLLGRRSSREPGPGFLESKDTRLEES